MSDGTRTNALAGETSPYLLQHAHNPVDWFPWSEEALRRAREEDKPILLSIGYSACHWCHVMERECFENEQIARLMNRHFVNIKVDREERPDLDAIYMNAVQMMTGGGGWPHDGLPDARPRPVLWRHVFPARGQARAAGVSPRPGRDDRGLPREEGGDSARRGPGASRPEAGRQPGIDRWSALLRDARHSHRATGGKLRRRGRRVRGRAEVPALNDASCSCLRCGLRTGNPQHLRMVEHTLDAMARGGIYDQLGGGFHRYSVDARWLVPHFEKMLYDNALLSRTYTEAWLATGKALYRRVAEETLDYVLREMTAPEGGFYSTQDADSEGHEGKFFVWDRSEVFSELPPDDAALFCGYFDITEAGNFEGRNILHVPRPPGDIARERGLDEAELAERIARSRAALFRRRETRVRPARDEKILTAWNGLMLRSFAEAANAFDRPDYREAALRNAAFILERLTVQGRLKRSYKDGRALHNAYLEDYSFLIDGLLALYQSGFDARWLREAERLAGILVQQFWDEEGGGFYFTSRDHEELIFRPKEYYDNATPSGNSVAVQALLRLAHLTAETGWSRYAERILGGMTPLMSAHPSAFSNLLCGLDFLLSSPLEIAVSGDPRAPDTRALLREVSAATCRTRSWRAAAVPTFPCWKARSRKGGARPPTCAAPRPRVQARPSRSFASGSSPPSSTSAEGGGSENFE